MKKIYLFLLVSSFFIIGCEKDDICDANTPTTPRLVVTFNNAAVRDNVRIVTDLKITGYDENGVLFDETKSFLINDTLVKIPLNPATNFSKFQLILNSNSTTLSSIDLLQFNYTHNDVFVSRACGFKTIFNLDENAGNPFIINNNPTLTQGNWIKNIEVFQPDINNENETHIKIFF